MARNFVHLHLHTEYSLLDGAIRLRDLPRRLKELGMSACAMTDHGTLYGAVEFYQAMQAEGLKPILGLEAYVAPRRLTDKDGAEDRNPYHLILLAENLTGWHNLIRLASLAFTQGYYYRPRIDWESLCAYHDGLICLSACLGGETARQYYASGYEALRRTAKRYQALFGEDNYFLEIQANDLPEQLEYNRALIRLAHEEKIALAATNDCHYLLQEDWEAQDVLLCLQTGSRLSDEKRMRMQGHSYYLKSADEMAAAFPGQPEALANTVRIAERCQVEMEFGKLFLPKFQVPPGLTPLDYLRQLASDGLRMRLQDGQQRRQRADRYEARLAHELDVIASMGYVDYFLVVWDFIHYAHRQGIMVGPGRGSGAGSLVAYAIEITDVDPLQYDLLFERFLNPDRVSLPDFDTDFCYERRQEMIDYVTAKYGSDHVAQIVTFGTLAAKAAIRDVARVLDYPYATGDRLAHLIPDRLNISLPEALRESQELAAEYQNNAESKRLLDLCLKLEGLPRHSSTHAAGVVISGKAIAEVAPLSLNDDVPVVQYTMKHLEEVGLLKFDFLGLRTLTVIRDAIDLIQENWGRQIDFHQIPYQDEAVYQMLSEGDTAGVFQLESRGMTAFMKELRPNCLEDIIAGISLYRPGPMEQIPRYLQAAKEGIRYEHPLLEPILCSTRGCIVYQEQVMRIVRDLAGFSLGQADNVRRAMSKKKAQLLASYRELFLFGGRDEKGQIVEGAVAKGLSPELAEKIFDEVMAFAGYAFNKAHAAGYAVLAFQTAWLKCYYPVEFMAAMLNSFLDSIPKLTAYIQVCRERGIRVLPPDINLSRVKFTTEGGAIRFALSAIKNVGREAMRQLVADRQAHGNFSSFPDFIRRASVLGLNRKMIESLIKANALSSFPANRAQLLAALEAALSSAQQQKRQVMEGQLSLFTENEMAEGQVGGEDFIYPEVKAYTPEQLLQQEKEVTGLYLSGHLLDSYEDALPSLCNFSLGSLAAWQEEGAEAESESWTESFSEGQLCQFAAVLIKRKIISTRKQERMAFLEVEDRSGSCELIVFPKLFEKRRALLAEGSQLLIRGKLSLRDEEPKILAEDLWALPEAVTAWRDRQAGRLRQQDLAGRCKQALAQDGLYLHWELPFDAPQTRSLLAMLHYFQGETSVHLRGAGGSWNLPDDYAFDLQYLPILIKRYGEDLLERT